MNQTQNERVIGLDNACRALASHLGRKLAGSRQATEEQIVQLLAREFELDEVGSRDLFSRLQESNLVVREVVRGDASAETRFCWRLREVTEEMTQEGDGEKIVAGLTQHAATPAIDLLQRAFSMRASDIHLEPYGDEVEVRFRIDGLMEHYCRMSHEVGAAMMNQLKLMADLDIAEPFRPKEGRMKLPIFMSNHEARITTAHVTGGETIAVRLLSHDRIVRPLEELGFSGYTLRNVQQLLCHGEGIVLVTGPTGVGKTTTVYSLVSALDNGHRNIVSMEDPVEFSVPAILQMEVDPRHDVTFVSGLKTLLRLDPDIVLIGEIRDPSTAAVAMRAASSGKYVFCTFHTRDVASTITGLRDLEVDSRSLAGNIRGIISQRLIRRLCVHCRQFRETTDFERDVFLANDIEPPEQLATAQGCQNCRNRGYHDRIGVFEIEANSQTLAQAIEQGASEDELRLLLRQQGTQSLVQDALRKVKDGYTSLDETGSMTWVTFKSKN